MRRFNRPWLIAGVIASLATIATRWWISHGRTQYTIWPDEPAQLAIARFASGGTRWNMHDHSTWRPLYATLIAPLHWLFDDPIRVYQAALVVNALLGGVATALLVVLARRLTSLTTWAAAAAAILVSVAPAALFPTEFVWSESLVVPTFLGTLLALLSFRERPSLGVGVAAATLAAAAFGSHSRMLPLTVITVAVVALEVRRRRLAATTGALIVAWTAAGFLAVTAYSGFVVDRLWDEPTTRNSYGGIVAQLGKVGATFASFVGQSWYLLVTTAGVAGLGVIALARLARRRQPGDTDRATSAAADARLVLAVVGAHVALAMVFMSDRWRPDQVVYGRYNDAVVGPVVLVGIGELVTSSSVRRLAQDVVAVAVATAVLGGLLVMLRGDELSEGAGVRAMILGLQPFLVGEVAIPVVTITIAAIVVALLVGAVAGGTTRLAGGADPSGKLALWAK
ncbi:MAG: hypothetical protein H0U21_02710 [Acidimicrobiia bacterium]|nr:hypothetical protein [Acidimicrobiia bacterium]